jgi:TRAP-type C4-dicarboxylate transport system permease small subunit
MNTKNIEPITNDEKQSNCYLIICLSICCMLICTGVGFLSWKLIDNTSTKYYTSNNITYQNEHYAFAEETYINIISFLLVIGFYVIWCLSILCIARRDK